MIFLGRGAKLGGGGWHKISVSAQKIMWKKCRSFEIIIFILQIININFLCTSFLQFPVGTCEIKQNSITSIVQEKYGYESEKIATLGLMVGSCSVRLLSPQKKPTASIHIASQYLSIWVFLNLVYH